MRYSIPQGDKAIFLADQAIVSGTAVFTQFIVAKMLGLEMYGYFSALTLAQLFLLSVQQASLTGIFQVVYPTVNGGKGEKLQSGVWTVILLFAAALVAVSFPVFKIYTHGFTIGDYYAAILNCIFFLFHDFWRRVFISQKNGKTLLIIDLLNNGLQAIGLLMLLVKQAYSFSLVLWICALSYVPALVISYWYVKPSFSISNGRNFFNAYFSESGWMGLSALLQWFAGNFYVLAAGWWLGAASLGLLRLGQYVFGLLNVVLQAIESYIIPRASSFAAKPEQAVLYLKSVQKKMVLFIIVLIPLILILVKPLGNFLKYDNTGDLLVVVAGLCMVNILVVVSYPVRVALRVFKMGRHYFKGYVLNAFIGICTAYLFISFGQLKGVMAGLFLSQAILLIYWTFILQKQYKVLWK